MCFRASQISHPNGPLELPDEAHDTYTDSRSSLRPVRLIVQNPISVQANELINDFTARETTPCCGFMIHQPTIPISKLNRKHHTVTSMTAHMCTSLLNEPHLKKDRMN